MAALNSRYIEFEFVINSTVNIFTAENNKQYIRIPENQTTVLAYQNWNVKTPDANNGDRLVFAQSLKKLYKASENIRNYGKRYTPTVLLTIGKKHYLFSVDELKQTNDYSIILPINNNIHYGLTPPDGDNLIARLNLSTIPYYFLDDTIEEFSYGHWASSDRYNNPVTPAQEYENGKANLSEDYFVTGFLSLDSKYPTYSFLLEGEAQSISTSIDGKTQNIYFNLGTGLFPYEQWSISHEPEYTRHIESLNWADAINQTDNYNSHNINHRFTPTVLIEMNNQKYLGVIVNSQIIDVDGGVVGPDGHLGDLTQSKMIEVTIDTTRMKRLDKDGKNSIAMLPEITTPTEIFMNIDNPPDGGKQSPYITLETVESDTNHGGSIHADEILKIEVNGSNSRSLNFPGYTLMPGVELSQEQIDNPPPFLPRTLVNFGKIKLVGGKLTKTDNTFINLENAILVNSGEISIEVNEINSDLLSSFIEGGTIVNHGLITIDNITSNKSEGFDDIVMVTGSKGKDFTFLNSQVVNYGTIRFPIVINDAPITVIGINKVILNSTGVKGIVSFESAAKQDELEAGYVPQVSRMLSDYGIRKGSIVFNGLQSKMLPRDSVPIGDRLVKPTNMTIGIKTVLDNNTGTIIFGEIINGPESFGNITESLANSKNDVVQQSTVGILYMGAIDDGNYHSKAALLRNIDANHGYSVSNAVPHYFNQFLPETMLQKNDFKLTNPNYNNYNSNLMPDINPDTTIKEHTSNIMGCGYASLIFIGSVYNNTIFRNDETLMGACGIFNQIQIDNTAVTYIGEVVNRGFGGISACMGIGNLLVNMGQIHISEVNNICQYDYNEFNYSTCSGILNVVQNGYNVVFDDDTGGNSDLAREARKQLQRSTLPPFPPVHYDYQGRPAESRIETLPGYYAPDMPKRFSDLMTNETYSKISKFITNPPDYEKELFIRIYKQGHISINYVLTTSYHNEIAVGIKQYGGLSFDSNVMEDAPGILNYPEQPISIASHMKRYVNQFTGAATQWAYPTAENIAWSPSSNARSPLIEKTYPADADNNYLNSSQLDEQIRKDGWHHLFSNPVQMYYKYKGGDDWETQDYVTDIIFIPINWGIVTINYVVSGGRVPLDSTIVPKIKGSAYGLEKVLSCMGTMQINVIESQIEQESIRIDTEASVKVNTPEQPEVSRLIYGEAEGGNENDDYFDLPIKYAFAKNVTAVNFQSINDLPLNVVIDSGDIADPSDRIEGIWTTGTETSINMRWPYHITSKEEIENPNHHSSHYDLQSEFTLPDGFTPNHDSVATNLLETLMSPGAAYACLRTIDYGSGAPGLQFLRSWTAPIEVKHNEGDAWNNSRSIIGTVTYGGRIVRNGGKSLPEQFTPENLENHTWSLCGRDNPLICGSSGTLCEVDPKVIEINQMNNQFYGLTPVPLSIRDKMQKLHYDIQRGPVANAMGKGDSPWSVDYLHYPFRPNGGMNTSYIGSEGGTKMGYGKGYNNNERVGSKLPEEYSVTPAAKSAPNPPDCYIYPFYRVSQVCDDYWYGCADGQQLAINTAKNQFNINIDSSIVNSENPWLGVSVSYVKTELMVNGATQVVEVVPTVGAYGLWTSDCSSQLKDIVENPTQFNPIKYLSGSVSGTKYRLEKTPLDYLDSDFEEPQNNPSLYIYNNIMLNAKLAMSYHQDVFKPPPADLDPHFWNDPEYEDSSLTWEKPQLKNSFHGALPFPWRLPNNTVGPPVDGVPLADLDNLFSALDYTTRTFQDYIPICETILFNPACYPVHNPHGVVGSAHGGNFNENDLLTYIMVKSNDDTDDDIVDFQSKTLEHDRLLNKIYPHKTTLETDTNMVVIKDSASLRSMPSHFNTVISGWVYDEGLKQLYDHYFGNSVNTLVGTGRTGPLKSVYYTFPNSTFDTMRGIKESCVANFLSYSYSSTKPIGFNPQLIRGGYWKLRDDNPNTDDIVRDSGLASAKEAGFNVISKGKHFVRHLVPEEELNYHPFNYANTGLQRATHDMAYVNKYTTNNTYYGFSFETRNPKAKLDYLSYEMIEGAYSRYIGLQETIENLMYTWDGDAGDYTKKIIDNSQKETEKREKEFNDRKARQTSGAWSLLANFAMMLVLTKMSH